MSLTPPDPAPSAVKTEREYVVSFILKQREGGMMTDTVQVFDVLADSIKRGDHLPPAAALPVSHSPVSDADLYVGDEYARQPDTAATEASDAHQRGDEANDAVVSSVPASRELSARRDRSGEGTEREGVPLLQGGMVGVNKRGAAMKIFKIEAQGDVLFIQAATEPEALDILTDKMGEIPASLLTVSVVDELPAGEEFL